MAILKQQSLPSPPKIEKISFLRSSIVEISKVAVLGAGTMGAGIAQWLCQVGCQVELSDAQIEQRERAKDNIFSSWDKLQAKGKFTPAQVISFKSSLLIKEEFSKDCDLFIEAIIENLTIKTEVFQKLSQHFEAKTIMASNTSSIPIDAMARELPKDRQSKFLGLHFFNPAPIMKLVEIIQGHWTDKSIGNNLQAWFQEKGKKPALCQDGPGFIVNRLARNFYGEPLRLARVEDTQRFSEIDDILKEVGGFRMGPFELMDLIGIDINYSVSESVWKSFYYEPRFAPHPLQRKVVTSGRLGRKTKAGFYEYS